MGRHNLAALKVHTQATQLLQLGRLAAPPAWYSAVGNTPAAEVLTRRPMQKKQSRSKRASRMYTPLQLDHKEDKLRWEFFNDHPWELARPRVVVEDDGRDQQRWDWSHALCRPRVIRGDAQSLAESRAWDLKQHQQASRPINGEAVVQRQQWLMDYAGLSQAAAYDKARKEFYAVRHAQEIEQRVAKEESTYYGGTFGMTAIEVGMLLEDKTYESWRKWAVEQTALQKATISSAYTGAEMDEVGEDSSENEIDQVLDSVP